MNNGKSGRTHKVRRNQDSAPEGLNGTGRGNGAQKEIIVNVSNRETRIALLEDGQLMEYRVEREERVVGSIFKGIVQNVLPGMDAAFVDIGLERNAFLYVADILPEESQDNSPASLKRSELRRRKIKDLLKPGQQVMVQVTKGAHGTKGARVSTRIALPGRYVVLMPESSHVGVSRKIEDRSERERLRKIGDRIIPDGFGLMREFELLQEAGFHPLEVLRAATSHSADLLGLGDAIAEALTSGTGRAQARARLAGERQPLIEPGHVRIGVGLAEPRRVQG